MLTKLWCWLFGHSMWKFICDLDENGKPIQTGSNNPISGEPGFVGRKERQLFCSVCGHEDLAGHQLVFEHLVFEHRRRLNADNEKVAKLMKYVEEVDGLLPGAGSWADKIREMQGKLQERQKHLDAVDRALKLHPPTQGENRNGARIFRIECVVKAAEEHWKEVC